ncbi:MAG: ribonuclease toxin immunity protein CdiI [Peptococcaceae bacterium]|nr:ribonuclease toxin immunity protein CdiI [Peptococcaceae bacterium]
MKRDFRLQDTEMLCEEHFPVQAVFNAVNDTRFIKVIQGISQGQGFGENYGACVFPGDLDDYDIEMGVFEGVEFGLHNGDEILLDYPTFYYYLKKVCDGYVQEYPQEQEIIVSLLNTF